MRGGVLAIIRIYPQGRLTHCKALYFLNPKIEKKRTKPNWYNDFNKKPFHPLSENTKDNQPEKWFLGGFLVGGIIIFFYFFLFFEYGYFFLVLVLIVN